MKKSIVFLLVSFFIISCSTISSESKGEENSTQEEFKEFYEKFHTDSLFQMERINFPLEGYNIGENYNPMEDNGDFVWEKSNWEILKIPIVNEMGFKREFEKEDGKIFERLYIEDSGFEILFEYELKNGKWFLVYYGNSGM